MDFTLTQYRKLLVGLKSSEHHFFRFDEFVELSVPPGNSVVLRHDVDRSPINALKMAQLESELGIKATYYFRHMPNTFKPRIIKAIAEMGHEIGFHYESLSKTRGNLEQAYALFQKELNDLRAIAPIKTICMHGRPLLPYDNRDLWKAYDFKSLGLIAEPYLSIDYAKVQYFTDTGRSWSGDRFNLRDRVNHQDDKPRVSTTDELLDWLGSNQAKPVIVQTHPERWSYSVSSFAVGFARDWAVNFVKLALFTVNRLKKRAASN